MKELPEVGSYWIIDGRLVKVYDILNESIWFTVLGYGVNAHFVYKDQWYNSTVVEVLNMDKEMEKL